MSGSGGETWGGPNPPVFKRGRNAGRRRLEPSSSIRARSKEWREKQSAFVRGWRFTDKAGRPNGV